MVHNERIKLLAGALNNLGLAFAIGGFVASAIGDQLTRTSAVTTIFWLIFGAVLHASAQFVLGKLKP